MWIVTGTVSVLMTILTWIFALKRDPKKNWSALSAVAFMALTILMHYRLVLGWVNGSDWAALMDVVPGMYAVLCAYAILIILGNGLAVLGPKRK